MKYVKLDKLCDITMGQSPDSSSYNDKGIGLPFFQGKSEFGKIYPTAKMYCTEPKKTAQPLDILMSVRAPVGDVNISNIDCCIGRGLCSIRCKNNINYKYIYYYLLTQKKVLESQSTGSTFKAINKSIVSELEIPLQDLDAQHKIVEVLEKAQELIDKRKEQMELLEELVQSRFLEMFGNPVTNPKGWEVEKINTIAPIEQYKGEINDGKVWLLNLDMVESNSGRIINYNYVDKEEVGNSTCTFSTDNVLYSKLRPYLNKVAIPDREGYATSEMIPLKPNREILNREYFAYSLRSKAFVDYISEKVSGAKMPRVVMSDFKNFKLPIPPLALQEEFADFVGKVNDIKIVLNKSLEQLNNNFDSLISRAFKGELF